MLIVINNANGYDSRYSRLLLYPFSSQFLEIGQRKEADDDYKNDGIQEVAVVKYKIVEDGVQARREDNPDNQEFFVKEMPYIQRPVVSEER